MVRLWDPLTGQPVGEPLGHPGGVSAVCAVPLPDGRTLLASAGWDRTVLVWAQRTAGSDHEGHKHATK
jgi:WD40 repeat protein